METILTLVNYHITSPTFIFYVVFEKQHKIVRGNLQHFDLQENRINTAQLKSWGSHEYVLIKAASPT